VGVRSPAGSNCAFPFQIASLARSASSTAASGGKGRGKRGGEEGGEIQSFGDGLRQFFLSSPV